MSSIIFKILSRLEDSNRPMLGPNVKWLELWGLILPKSGKKKIMYMTIYMLIFIFIATEYIDMWISKSNLKILLQNMKHTMLSTVNAVKVFTFIYWQKHWKTIINFATDVDLERRKSKDKIRQNIIKSTTKYCRTVTYVYWCLVYCTIWIALLQPLVYLIYCLLNENMTNEYTNIEVVHNWLPINEDTLTGYLIKLSYQLAVTFYAGGWMTSFDSNAVVIIIFFRGELELLRRDGQLLYGTQDNPIDKEGARLRLAKCHKRYVDLLKYSRLFDSCLAPIMFLYVFVCSVMLCASAYEITIETSTMQRFITAEYLIFGVSQLFLYCWHSNDVLYVSKVLSLGPYESIWWTRDLSEQNNMYILADQFRKDIVFSAGPFTNINVATFISILKGAYSYYTLLSQSQQD